MSKTALRLLKFGSDQDSLRTFSCLLVFSSLVSLSSTRETEVKANFCNSVDITQRSPLDCSYHRSNSQPERMLHNYECSVYVYSEYLPKVCGFAICCQQCSTKYSCRRSHLVLTTNVSSPWCSWRCQFVSRSIMPLLGRLFHPLLLWSVVEEEK